MSTKLKIEGQPLLELPRGASIPKEDDIIYITIKGQKDERLYTVELIEHEWNFNMAYAVGTCTITLKEIARPMDQIAPIDDSPVLPKVD